MHAGLRHLIDSKGQHYGLVTQGRLGPTVASAGGGRELRSGAGHRERHSAPNRRERKPLLFRVAVASAGAVLA